MEDLKVGDFIKCMSFYKIGVTVGKIYKIDNLDDNKKIITFIDDDLDLRSIEIKILHRNFKKVDNQSQRNQEQRPSGGSTHYYELPKNATELKHLIRHKKMSHPIGEAFCSLYRLNDNGEYKRNLEKAKYYIETELQYLEERRD